MMRVGNVLTLPFTGVDFLKLKADPKSCPARGDSSREAVGVLPGLRWIGRV